MYQNINPKIRCYSNIWSELEKIANLEGGSSKAAERALTASVILLHFAQKWKKIGEPQGFILEPTSLDIKTCLSQKKSLKIL